MIIVSDTTPISELAKVKHLDLLPQIFGKVVIPQAVGANGHSPLQNVLTVLYYY